MKYGETLRQRSILAWSHHNIDYDDIKHFIKEHTTPGTGKSISIPGRGDDRLREAENALFIILRDQHERINLFVKSKAGEIQRRLDHSRKQLRQLAARESQIADQAAAVPLTRLQRYGKLEEDVIKAGDEIKSLARFTATQRTAFRKLLKKYKKWSGSSELEYRFRDEVLDDLKSFTRLDLGPLLDDYSHTQQGIRALYEGQLRPSIGSPSQLAASSTVQQLQDALNTGSKVFFDSAMATVPLGDKGTFASYFVHLENVVELQMLLLQHSRFYYARSRPNSIASPVTAEAQTTSFTGQNIEVRDCHMLVADDLHRFSREQSSLTVDDKEHSRGACSQRARAVVRWNNTEDALASLRSRSGRTRSAFLKRKHVQNFFSTTADFAAKQDTTLLDSAETIEDLRREMLQDHIRVLFQYSCCRSRLVGLDDGSRGLVLATLDTAISIQDPDSIDNQNPKCNFPFALLLVRREGKPKSDLLSALDNSHLVERVRGFSLEYHGVWQSHHPESISAPFWMPMLTQDIRKLPPPMLKRTSTAEALSSGSQTARSSGSITGRTDSTTAVEEGDTLRLETPALQSFRKKKRRRAYAEQTAPQDRYWSEYDHPEDGDGDQGAYVIYIDPDAKSTLETVFEKLTSFFRTKSFEKEPLLSPTTPPGEELSSDDEEIGFERSRYSGFGTFGKSSVDARDQEIQSVERSGLSRFAGTSFAASLAILLMAYILHSTSKKKYLREVHYGVLFAILCSLAFMLTGLLSVLRTRQPVTYFAWALSIIVLLIDAIGCGGLLAWMLG